MQTIILDLETLKQGGVKGPTGSSKTMKEYDTILHFHFKILFHWHTCFVRDLNHKLISKSKTPTCHNSGPHICVVSWVSFDGLEDGSASLVTQMVSKVVLRDVSFNFVGIAICSFVLSCVKCWCNTVQQVQWSLTNTQHLQQPKAPKFLQLRKKDY